MRGAAMGLDSVLLAAAHAHPYAESRSTHSLALGVFAAILSALCNGTFTIFSKIDSIHRAHVDPLIFNFWACLGIGLSCFLVLIKHHFVWTSLGLLSGLIFVLSAANAYRAVRMIGVSVGTGVWCGTAVVVSFLGGLLVDPHGHVHNLPLAIVAILIILLGIGAIAMAGHMGHIATGREHDLNTLLQGGGTERHNFLNGLFAAILAGVLGGLIMLPMTRARPSARGLAFLPSFGIGVLAFAPIVTFIPFLTVSHPWPPFAPHIVAVPGIASGLIWNIGNAFSISAILYVGYSVAYPIMQTGLFVAGLWGMFLFDEISGSAASLFWGAGVLILVGISLLSASR